jgi:Ca2+-binding RTX toxin-like protein
MGIGDDTVTNSKAAVMHDDIRLGGGHDTLANSGSIGRSVEGGEGNDTIKNTGAIGKDVLLGNGLNSLTSSGTIYGQVSGGSDKDVVKNSGLIDGIVDLGGGDDNFTGGRHTEIVIDNAASDIVKLGGGDDFYFGIGNFNQAEDGLDLVDGGAGFDSYNAASATDSVYINLDNKPHDFSPFLPGAGLIAANTATGIGLSIDTIRNFEAVVGGAGSDIIYGSASGNLIVGGDGFDTLAGFGGNDVLIGGDGGDALWGGAGRDYLTGGAGADFFQFAAISESRLTLATRDAIMDFESGLDLIDLRPIDANSKSRTTDDAFTFIGDQAFSKVAGQLRAYAITGGQIVEGDVNGDGKADFSIEVVATPATLTLTAADFLL